METIVEVINYFLWIYGSLFALIVLIGFSLQRNKERSYSEGKKLSASDITVLVPFRNESENLPALLESIQKLDVLPAQMLFIDDHSDDDSVAIINNNKGDLPIRIVEMPEGRSGKKQALREGAKLVTTEFTLTWDADIVVGADYFTTLETQSEADMYVLPALFSTTSFVQQLFSMDVLVANAVNMGLAGWKRPIFASGANLLYRTRIFEQLDSIQNHQHISSGDDTFLLRDFTRNNASVRLSSNPALAVITPAPKSLGMYVSQRLRWVSKTNALGDWLNSLVAGVQLLFTIAFLALLIWCTIETFWFGLVYLLACKTVTDFLVFGAYFKQIKRSGMLLLLPIAELWFPLYSLLLAVLIPFYQPKWKGRKIVSK